MSTQDLSIAEMPGTVSDPPPLPPGLYWVVLESNPKTSVPGEWLSGYWYVNGRAVAPTEVRGIGERFNPPDPSSIVKPWDNVSTGLALRAMERELTDTQAAIRLHVSAGNCTDAATDWLRRRELLEQAVRAVQAVADHRA